MRYSQLLWPLGATCITHQAHYVRLSSLTDQLAQQKGKGEIYYKILDFSPFCLPLTTGLHRERTRAKAEQGTRTNVIWLLF